MSVDHWLDPLFDFSSVAVVGASDRGGTGARPLRSLQLVGFQGRYYPVNARSDNVQGMRAYPNVSSLPETPDMVVVAIPREGVPGVIDECGARGVKAAVILSAGFLDRGDAHGAEMQARITATARERGLLVVGPNCLGLMSVVNHCAACTATPPSHTGNVAVISHSGGLMNEVISCGVPRGIGFSHAVSAGNEAGVSAADLIDYFVHDPATDVILAILETARDPAGFVAAATRAAEARKPLVVLKMGWSEKGARSAFTHTGANTGNDAVYTALFRQKGVIRVNDIDELVDMGALLAPSIGVLREHRLEQAGIIEISGGGKGLVSDTAAAAGVVLTDLSDAATAALQKELPEETFATNPIDTGGSWGDPDKAEVYPTVLSSYASEPDFEVIVSRYTVPRTGELGVLDDRLAELETARAAHPDRLFPVLSRTCDQFCEAWEQAIRERHIPFVQGYGRGLRALGLMAQYSRFIHGPRAEGPSLPASDQRLTAAPVSQTARLLAVTATQELLASLGVTVSPPMEPGMTIVLGAYRDAQFGPVVTFGLGDVIGDVLNDRALRLAPLTPDDARAMLDEIRGRRLLDSGSGRPAADRAALERALCGLSDLMLSRADIARIDINPAVVHEKGLTATGAYVELTQG